MRAVRALLGAAGLAAAGWGAWLLLGQGATNLRATLVWLAGGVLLHDAVLAPLTIAVAWVAGRLAGGRPRAPAAVALVLLGPLTVAAVPVLGRFGARADNTTLLDRPYWAGWTALVVVVLVAILVASYAGRRGRAHAPVGGGDDGDGDGRR
jgi:hypothetical protein